MKIERLNYIKVNAAATNSLLAVNKDITSIAKGLRALIELRISQINGCAYCVDLHAEQARAAGETQQRLDCIAAWTECPFFDAREKAALAWAEALTRLPDTHAPNDLYRDVTDHFSDEQVVDLTFIIATMNAWNRIAVSFRHVPVERQT